MRKFVSLCCLLMLLGYSFGQEKHSQEIPSTVFQIDSFFVKQDVSSYLEVLFDPENRYQLSDLLEGDVPFQKFDELESPFFPADANPWIRIALRNELPNRQFWGISSDFYTDSTRWYLVDESAKIDTFLRGRMIFPDQVQSGSEELNRLYDASQPIVITLKTEQTKYLYAKMYPVPAFSSRIGLKIRSAESLYEYLFRTSKDYSKSFFFLGLVGMFWLYNLLIFLFSKEKSNLYLALYTLCFWFPAAPAAVGYYVHFFHLYHPFFLDIRWVLFSPLAYVFGSLFIQSYLNSKQDYPNIHKLLQILKVVGIAYLFFCVGLYLIGGPLHIEYTIIHGVIINFIAFGIFLLIGIKLYRDDRRKWRFLLGAYSFMFFFTLFRFVFDLVGLSAWSMAIQDFFMPVTMGDIGLLGQVAILTLGVGYRSREIAQEKKRLEDLNRFKSQFFANITHEFRTPLTLVLGPLKQLMEESKSEKEYQLLEVAYRNASRQLLLLNELLDLSKLDAEKMELRPRKVEMVSLLKGMLYAYESLAEQKEVGLEFDCSEDEIYAFVDVEMIEKVGYNLLSNAFKFTPKSGTISVSLSKEAEQLQIIFRDTGIGISAERLPKVFERFFQAESGATDRREGTGIGLALSKELVELHDGRIWVESELDKGTSFFVELPLKDAYFDVEAEVKERRGSDAQLEKEIIHFTEATTHFADTDASQSKKPKLLLVEDNADMRAFMRQRIADFYEVIEAVDGEEGIEKALSELPDLIISDVMMPKKNGYELCAAVKQHIQTSHIPIILLTAKSAQEAKIEGLETGADDYLVKPFDAKELLVRCKNLIELRQQLRQRFAESVSLQPSQVTSNSIDQVFLEKALQIVEENIENENFKVDDLGEAVGMSRATLNRKLRALTDQSSNQFIKSIRLNRAADLLKNDSQTIAEIAHQTGFNSSTYFVRCFKEQFGETPGNFRKNAS